MLQILGYSILTILRRIKDEDNKYLVTMATHLSVYNHVPDKV